ncbi:MAG TPA: sensor histidine kinase [Planctomycetota bacterium]|nr:sensor histidine kinase [Planctomycetota bacterium]
MESTASRRLSSAPLMGSEGVAECALGALARGEDGLAASLGRAVAAAGASLALWRGQRGLRWCRGRVDGLRLGELVLLERSLPLGDLARRLNCGDLMRLPGPVARGSRQAWIARAPGGGLLWLEAPRAIDIDGPQMESISAQLATVERLGDLGAGAETARLSRLGARAAAVAHDCRHLASLATFQLERGIEGAQGSEELARTLGELRSLCRDFLHGGTSEPWEEVSLGPLLKRELEGARRIARRGSEVTIYADLVDAPTLRTRPGLLRRVLRNLVLNGIQSCPPGTEVSLSIEREIDGVQIVVADSGRGMQRADLDLLRAGASGRGGTGFGTVSILECIDGLGARLWIESLPGVGTRCVVRLPRA